MVNKKQLVLFFTGELLSIAAAGVALFWSAGRLDW